MSDAEGHDTAVKIEEVLARLERRLTNVEVVLGLHEAPEEQGSSNPSPLGLGGEEGELEFAVGQNLFAKVGIFVLAIGAGLTLSLPWQGVSPIVPSAAGWLLAGVLFLLARWLEKSLPLISRHFRGAAMALLFFATLRLCYFGEEKVLAPSSVAAAGALTLAVVINLVIGWWRKSVLLIGLAMLTGYAAALAVGVPWYVLGMVTFLTLVAGVAARHHKWPWLVVFASPCGFITYLLWALGNPVVGNRIEVVAGPFAGVIFLLLWMAISAVAMTCRRDRADEDPVAQAGSVANCSGYVVFLLHTLARYGDQFVAANVAASLALLGIAVLFWVRERSQFATFIYAMTGYGALSMALIKATEVPNLFVWLSAQSLLVISTAIWFRSRFIIVANFLIYLAVVACYMVMVQQETGISFVFGMVALTSARILKWQMDRLELKTEMMRNAYLISAFIVFPYALFHMMPRAWVAVSWIGVALLYYLMNLFTKGRKYRWMGHNTLLLTVIYILVMSIGRLQGTQRIVSFLALGTVLLVVSLAFTLIRARQHRAEAPEAEPEPAKPPPSVEKAAPPETAAAPPV